MKPGLCHLKIVFLMWVNCQETKLVGEPVMGVEEEKVREESLTLESGEPVGLRRVWQT